MNTTNKKLRYDQVTTKMVKSFVKTASIKRLWIAKLNLEERIDKLTIGAQVLEDLMRYSHTEYLKFKNGFAAMKNEQAYDQAREFYHLVTEELNMRAQA